jgi:hypothetical protein
MRILAAGAGSAVDVWAVRGGAADFCEKFIELAVSGVYPFQRPIAGKNDIDTVDKGDAPLG